MDCKYLFPLGLLAALAFPGPSVAQADEEPLTRLLYQQAEVSSQGLDLRFDQIEKQKGQIRGIVIHQGSDRSLPPCDAVIGDQGRRVLRNERSSDLQVLIYFDDQSFALLTFQQTLSAAQIAALYRDVEPKQMPAADDGTVSVVSTLGRYDALFDRLHATILQLDALEGLYPPWSILKGHARPLAIP